MVTELEIYHSVALNKIFDSGKIITDLKSLKYHPTDYFPATKWGLFFTTEMFSVITLTKCSNSTSLIVTVHVLRRDTI